jgi:hypothetical protein
MTAGECLSAGSFSSLVSREHDLDRLVHFGAWCGPVFAAHAPMLVCSSRNILAER